MKGLLQQWATAQAMDRPEACAVTMTDQRITYGQLEGLSNRLARLLRATGCQRGDRVCLLMPKSPRAIVAILSVLKADCTYVPLDVSSPAPRLAHMIASSAPRCLLATRPAVPLLDQLLSDQSLRTTLAVGSMEEESLAGTHFRSAFSQSDFRAYSGTPLQYQNSPDDPAYILFTSGSTGVPKGVVITHSNVTHFVEWGVDYFGLGPDDRISGHPPLHFDLSVFDIFGAFASGAELHLVSPTLNLLPNMLADFIRASHLTQWFSVPSVLAHLAKFDVVRFSDFPALRRVLWCGEVLPTPVLTYWMKRLPTVRFTNLYGPTETTIASSYYTVPACPEDERAAIPIGTACPGEELLLLDEKLQAVLPGEIGDLYIRGAGLSTGYWRDPERTRAAFLPNPFSRDPSDRIYRTGDLARLGADGLVYFLGRADSQIKSRGYRIELGEIETHLDAVAWLKESAVVAISSEGLEGAAICCAYVPAPDRAVTPVVLRKELAKALPSYMLPSRWMSLNALPRNANGKVDRPRLRELFLRDGAQTS